MTTLGYLSLGEHTKQKIPTLHQQFSVYLHQTNHHLMILWLWILFFPSFFSLLCQISSLCASTKGLLYPLASDWFSHVEANSCRLEERKTVRLENILPKLAPCHYWDVLSRNPFTLRVPMTLSPPSSGLGVVTAC